MSEVAAIADRILRDGSHPVSRTQAAGQLSKLWHLLK